VELAVEEEKMTKGVLAIEERKDRFVAAGEKERCDRYSGGHCCAEKMD
jgi:hypothetical protein